MLKKIIPVVLTVCLFLGVSVMAENTADGSIPAEVPQEIPQGEQPQGGHGDIGMPPDGNMQRRTPPERIMNGEMPQGGFTPPEGVVPAQNREELTIPESSKNNAETAPPPANENVTTENQQEQEKEKGEETNQPTDANQQPADKLPGGMGGFPGNMQNFDGQTREEQPEGFAGFVKTYSTPITSVVLLGLAFIFVIFYRRKNY